MPVLDIEYGRRGLEVEAKGKVILWVAFFSFIGGLAIGGYLGFRARDRGGKFIKKLKKDDFE